MLEIEGPLSGLSKAVRNANGIEDGIDAEAPLSIGWIAGSGSDFGILHRWRGVRIAKLQRGTTADTAAHTAAACATAAHTTS